MTRSYSELIKFDTFKARYEYLRMPSKIGMATFGFDRYLNQRLYRSREWKRARNIVIARDGGYDLGMEEHPIYAEVTVHHMNPMSVSEVELSDPTVFDPEFLITTCRNTHLAIHSGNRSLLPQPLVVRRPGDTNLWTPLSKRSQNGS